MTASPSTNQGDLSAPQPPAAREAGVGAARAHTGSLLLALSAACAVVAYRDVMEIGAGGNSRLPDAETFLFEPSASAPVLVLGALLWLLASRWHRIRTALGAPPRRLTGATALAGAVIVAGWAWAVDVPTLLLPSITLWMLGAALWLGGIPGLRALWLPAVFVLFAYPTPPAIVNAVIYPLQLAVADVAAWMLRTVGLAVAVEGDRLAFRQVVFQVIESCSGMRGTQTLIMSAVLYVEIFHRTRLRSVLIVGFSPLIGLFVNQLRVLTIMLNPYSHIAAVHTAQGLVMIVLGVLLLAGLDSLLGRVLPEPRPGKRRRLPPRSPLSVTRWFPVAATSVILLVGSFVWEPWRQPERRFEPLARFPVEIDGQPAKGLKLDKQFLGTTTFSEWVRRSYGTGDSEVEVFLGGDDRRSGGVRLLSSKTAVLESGWSVIEQGRHRLESGREVDWLVLRSGPRRQLAWHWREGVGQTGAEILRGVLALDRSPWGVTDRAVVVRVATPLRETSDGRRAADARLARVASEVEQALGELLRARPQSRPSPS
ncbi:exosortase-associated EpsI family protein [Myxococcota bacterium]|nr:exosortase-associated EpsI family protein [Myxococcota bacterium]